MSGRNLTAMKINEYKSYLKMEEKSKATIEKYLRDIHCFWRFAAGEMVSKELVIAYKKYLIESGYAVRSINSMLASLNSLIAFCGWEDCKVKNIRMQQKSFCEEEKELSKGEYMRLLKAAADNACLYLILQTIGGTGIRISELNYFTVEAVKSGEIIVACKNKTRIILVPGKLKKLLLGYARKNGIEEGGIFIGKTGKPLNRSCIWRKMKRLCEKAGVQMSKVFPHNLRKLFARTYYTIEKDISKLADILGHSNINTTRIYIMTSGKEHRRQIESLGLVVGNVEEMEGEIKKQHN